MQVAYQWLESNDTKTTWKLTVGKRLVSVETGLMKSGDLGKSGGERLKSSGGQVGIGIEGAQGGGNVTGVSSPTDGARATITGLLKL